LLLLLLWVAACPRRRRRGRLVVGARPQRHHGDEPAGVGQGLLVGVLVVLVLLVRVRQRVGPLLPDQEVLDELDGARLAHRQAEQAPRKQYAIPNDE
jgi:hypothetical protein